jgi:hypothetical protein
VTNETTPERDPLEEAIEAADPAFLTIRLPHPGVSDEFWALVPEKDREAFSGYLVAEDQVIHSLGGWCAPTETIAFADVTARRGGISFTSGPDLVGVTKPLLEMTKEELRDEITRLRREHSNARATLQKALRKERKRTRRLLRLIERIV